MCLLSAANIEYKNFEEKYHIEHYIAFFGTVLVILRNFLRSGKKTRKNGYNDEETFCKKLQGPFLFPFLLVSDIFSSFS